MTARTGRRTGRGFWADSWRRFRRRPAALVSLVLLVIVVVIALASIWWSPYNPNAQDILSVNRPPGAEGHLLGTDGLGRDLLSRLLAGLRVSLLIAFIAALLDLIIGVLYGFLGALGPPWLDTGLQRVIELFAGIPTLVVLVLMLTIFNPGLLSILAAMVLTGWIGMARLVRAQTLRLRESEYVLAARLLGVRPFRLAWRHILPNMLGLVIVQTMFTIPYAIFFEAFLSFIGLGLRPPTASLGTLMSDGFETFTFLPHQMLIPAAVLSVVMVAFNLLADGLRDAFDPKERR